MDSIRLKSPSWQVLGDLAMEQLKQGHTSYAMGIVPMMVEKLVALEPYANEDGKISISSPNKSVGEINKEFKENYPKGLDN